MEGQELPKIKSIKASELRNALDRAIKPIHFIFKKKNGEVLDTFGTRNPEYLNKLDLKRRSGASTDLGKLPTVVQYTYVEVPGGVVKKPRYPYWDTSANKWRSFTVGNIIGMTEEEVKEVVATSVFSSEGTDTYIKDGSQEAKDLLKDKIQFIKFLALADEVARKVNKSREDLNSKDVMDSGVSKNPIEIRKIVSAPRLYKPGTKVKINQ